MFYVVQGRAGVSLTLGRIQSYSDSNCHDTRDERRCVCRILSDVADRWRYHLYPVRCQAKLCTAPPGEGGTIWGGAQFGYHSTHRPQPPHNVVMNSLQFLRRVATRVQTRPAAISRRAFSSTVPESAMTGEDKSLNRLTRTESEVRNFRRLCSWHRVGCCPDWGP